MENIKNIKIDSYTYTVKKEKSKNLHSAIGDRKKIAI